MLFLIFSLLMIYLILKGFFKIVLPILVIALLLRLFVGGFLMLFSWPMWEFLIFAAVLIWLIRTVRRQR